MRVVIDTNILVSAAIAGRKPESIILWIIAQLCFLVYMLGLTQKPGF
jgi:predicted nucleic acid-binding protein